MVLCADEQMVSATHTNITPAKLEEFEATFKHFDKDETNVSAPVDDDESGTDEQTLQLWEMHSALASLGIVYAVRRDHLYQDTDSCAGH